MHFGLGDLFSTFIPNLEGCTRQDAIQCNSVRLAHQQVSASEFVEDEGRTLSVVAICVGLVVHAHVRTRSRRPVAMRVLIRAAIAHVAALVGARQAQLAVATIATGAAPLAAGAVLDVVCNTKY